MSAKSVRTSTIRLLAALSLLLCLFVLGFWLAGLRAVRQDPLWLRTAGDHVRYAIGSLDGQMELRRVLQDEHPLPGPHCGERAACARFEQQFPGAVRYEYLGCVIGREPVIDTIGREEQLVKTGTAWFVIMPHGVAALLLGILPVVVLLQRFGRRRTPISHVADPACQRGATA